MGKDTLYKWTGWSAWMRDHGLFVNGLGRPQIVTLCGSTRFVDDFNAWRKSFTLKGHIVLSIEIVTTQSEAEDPQHVDTDMKTMLDLLHLEKVKMSDWIFVINKGGYIGPSTEREIKFAEACGIPIEYLEPLTDGSESHKVLSEPT